MEGVLLHGSSICFGYDNKPLAAPFSFELNMGEVVALMGGNGCGKSTLLKTLAGFLPLLSGSVTLDGRLFSAWNIRERARKIALVCMSMPPPSRMTVREFVSLGRSPYSGFLDNRSEEDEKIVDDALTLLDIRGFADRPIVELSDGERSRVYLAEAIAQQVNVLLLDEPNAFLDIPYSHALFKILKQMAQVRKMSIVVSTHSIEYAEMYCDHIMVLHDGCVRTAPAKEARQHALLDWAFPEDFNENNK